MVLHREISCIIFKFLQNKNQVTRSIPCYLTRNAWTQDCLVVIILFLIKMYTTTIHFHFGVCLNSVFFCKFEERDSRYPSLCCLSFVQVMSTVSSFHKSLNRSWFFCQNTKFWVLSEVHSFLDRLPNLNAAYFREFSKASDEKSSIAFLFRDQRLINVSFSLDLFYTTAFVNFCQYLRFSVSIRLITLLLYRLSEMQVQPFL